MKNINKKVNNKDVEKLYFEFEKNSLNVNLISENYNIHIFGDSLYRIKKEDEIFLHLNLSILRAGLKLGMVENGRFEPSIHLAHFIKKEDCKISIDLDLLSINKFLKGETLKVDKEDGWALVCYKNLPISFSKISKNVLKNHYPKGLRINYDAI